ncbi:hypothetical protein RXA30_22340, partial [Dickeya solani]|uniref:hypothetical protein n=1 Tax=Dickeya solani TaxID=1089444 RepID=UPI0019D3993C
TAVLTRQIARRIITQPDLIRADTQRKTCLTGLTPQRNQPSPVIMLIMKHGMGSAASCNIYFHVTSITTGVFWR